MCDRDRCKRGGCVTGIGVSAGGYDSSRCMRPHLQQRHDGHHPPTRLHLVPVLRSRLVRELCDLLVDRSRTVELLRSQGGGEGSVQRLVPRDEGVEAAGGVLGVKGLAESRLGR